ncbi:MAG: hypothetical protein ACTSV1_10490 [Alphaproteobacteria bacterium]
MKRFIFTVALLFVMTGPARIAVAAEDPDDDTVLAMIQPYLDQVRPYLAPIEDILRERAEAFKTFVKKNISSGMRQDTPRVVIDLAPPPSR